MSAQDYYNSPGGQQPYPSPAQSSYPPQAQSPYPVQTPSTYPSYPPSQASSPYPGQQNYAQQQHLQPYSPQSPYDRPGSAQSNNGAVSPYDRPISAQSGYDPQQQSRAGTTPGQEGPDGERGFISTVGGGAAGAFIGSKLGHGKMSKIMGGAAGALAANYIENKLKANKHSHSSHGSYPQPQHHSASPVGGAVGGLLGGLVGGGKHSQHQQPYQSPPPPPPYQQQQYGGSGGYVPPQQPQYASGHHGKW
ncbi:hypothetical protein B0H66DRAFT_395361 [Apodospora peruviana]|uniref:Glycine zipper 2TM domain-containing protein n=1 Tax=Apodospora peruviana TaxID=516989 RepID=A0AAE0HSM5_9PEZI|nr:hypothetical protein B0H66DRAFT_395361 [Apodospora peruviana]